MALQQQVPRAGLWKVGVEDAAQRGGRGVDLADLEFEDGDLGVLGRDDRFQLGDLSVLCDDCVAQGRVLALELAELLKDGL